jgi:hypothetical protein
MCKCIKRKTIELPYITYFYVKKSKYKHHILTLVFMKHCVASGYHAAREKERSVMRSIK